nr:hypothetical protein CFP56_13805 [Quercus suber]
MKQLTIKVLRVTISLPPMDCVLEELLDSMAACSASRSKLVRASVSPIDIPSFTYCEIRREEVRVTNIYIGEKGAVHYEGSTNG